MAPPATNIADSLTLTQAEKAPEDAQMMTRVAKGRCLLWGDPVHDVQMWRRHIKQQRAAQRGLAQHLAESTALLQACIQRPCLWCKVPFQKAAREHRKKCHASSTAVSLP